jgi:hypothetical protein
MRCGGSPGHCDRGRPRRHLPCLAFWRYLLRWQRPAESLQEAAHVTPDGTTSHSSKPVVAPGFGLGRLLADTVLLPTSGNPHVLGERFERYRPHGALGGQTPYERLRQKTTAHTTTTTAPE